MRARLVVLTLSLVATLAARPSFAQSACWTECGVSLTPIPGYRGHPALAWMDSVGIAVWQDGRSGYGELYVAAIDNQGCVLPATAPYGARLSRASINASTFTMCTADDRAYVAWSDSRLGRAQPWWAVVDSTGRIDPRWPAGGAQLGTNPLPNRLQSVAATDSFVWLSSTVQTGSRYDALLFRRSQFDPESSPDWPASGLCVSCADTANASGCAIVPVSRERVYVSYYSGEMIGNTGTLIVSVIDHTPGSDSLGWTVRRLFQRPAFPNGWFMMTPDGVGGAYGEWVEGDPGTLVTRVVRLNASGVDPAWPDSGVAVHGPADAAELRGLELDDQGGVVTLIQKSSQSAQRLVVQRLGIQGQLLPGWPVGGLQISRTGYGVVINSRLGKMVAGRLPVVWTEQLTIAPDSPYVDWFSLVGPSGLVIAGGQSRTIVCTSNHTSGDPAVARIDGSRSAVLWTEPWLPIDQRLRLTAIDDDLTVSTEGSLQAATDCTPDGTRFTWRGDRLQARTLDVRRIAPDGSRATVATFTLDARTSSLDYVAPGPAADCFELAESGVTLDGSPICASCADARPGAPWRVTASRGEGSWRLQFRAEADLVLRVRVLDVAGRSVAEANQHLTPGVALTLNSESARLPIGWYRVRATDGTHVTDTALVVVR